MLTNDEEQELLEKFQRLGTKVVKKGARLEDVVSKAVDVQRFAYYRHIKDMCRYMKEHVLEEGGNVSDDVFGQMLHEEIDGDRWVFMTYLADVTTLVSNNYDACEEVYGDESPKIETQAYFAIEHDIRDRLSARQNTIKRSGPMGDQEYELIREHGQWIVIDKDGEEVSI